MVFDKDCNNFMVMYESFCIIMTISASYVANYIDELEDQ